MKNFVLPALWLGGALLCTLGSAQAAPAETTGARPANLLNTMVAPLAAGAPAETLLALARAADVNLLADVTDAGGAALPVVPASEARTLFVALKELTGARGWSWRRTSDRTFLLWKQPDAVALAHEIIAAQAAAPTAPVAVTTAATTAAEEPLNVALTRYFATPAARNDPKNPADWREVPLLELPPALRDRIMESVRGQQSGGLQFAASGAVLGDEFWKNAVLIVRELNAPGPRPIAGQTPLEPAKQKYLFVAGEFERAGATANTMLSLGRWKSE